MKNFGYGYACLFIHLWESCIVVMRQYKHIHPTMSLVNFEDATVSHFVGLLVGWVGQSVGQLVGPMFAFPTFLSSFCISAPAQLHATDDDLYLALFCPLPSFPFLFQSSFLSFFLPV